MDVKSQRIESDDFLLAEARIGIEAESFEMSPIGQYVFGRCDIEIMEAQEKLCEADPENPKLIRRLQNDIWVAKRLKTYFSEAIHNGREAERNIRIADEIGD